MARIRTIKPEMWQDEKLAPLDPLTRLVFLGLISMADDAGRVLDNLRLIDAFLFPETEDSSREALMTLSRIGRVRRGKTASGQRVIEIVNWARHQKIQHPNFRSALPEIIEEQPLTEIHEPVMSDSCGAHEALTHHTNDQRPTTNDQRPTVSAVADAPPPPALALAPEPEPDIAPKRRRTDPPPRAFPGITDAEWRVGELAWMAEAGSVTEGEFRKAFGPLFRLPESERPPKLARNAELAPAIVLYCAATSHSSETKWRNVRSCAQQMGEIVPILRRPFPTSEARVMALCAALGIRVA